MKLTTTWQVGSVLHKFSMRGLLLVVAATLLTSLALVPTANAGVEVTVGINPPVCAYGYYNYAPYGCAPSGFYGPGYFYNGIFLGIGPWANWGYGHGWGEHRFSGGGGGRYVEGRGRGPSPARARERAGVRHVPVHSSHAAAAHRSAPHAAPHAAAAHGREAHGGEEHH